VDAPFLAVVGVGLALLSVMTALRLSAVGVSGRRIALALVELWVAVGFWVRLLAWLSALGGAPAASGRGTGWLIDAMAVARAMPSGQRAVALANLGLVAVLLGHFMWSVSRVRPRQVSP
jgi:hypothetical protein